MTRGLRRRSNANDISEQMRNIARQMTPEEIDAVARYCGSQAAH